MPACWWGRSLSACWPRRRVGRPPLPAWPPSRRLACCPGGWRGCASVPKEVALPHIIDFEPVGRRGPCPEGGTLLDAARALGVDLASVCGGNGSCARCRVQIVTGEVTPVVSREAEKLPASDLAQGYRLACLAAPLSDCRVHVPPESLTALQRTQVEGLEVPAEVEPSVVSCTVQLPRPSLEDLRGDDERLCAALAAACGLDAAIPDLEVARLASTELRRLDWQARVTVRGHEVVHVAAVDSPWLGVAVDIGTTK
ncbi:MAG: hypothetical protein EHM56_08920, partial [Chloroflexi bacterium]